MNSKKKFLKFKINRYLLNQIMKVSVLKSNKIKTIDTKVEAEVNQEK